MICIFEHPSLATSLKRKRRALKDMYFRTPFACNKPEAQAKGIVRISRSRLCGLKGWQGMANSNTSPILACANSTFPEGAMRKSTTTLTPAQVYCFASDFCQPHLDFQAKGKVTATILLTVLFAAAARISSISETCRRLTDVPSEEIYAKALYAQLFCLEALVSFTGRMGTTLGDQWVPPERLRRGLFDHSRDQGSSPAGLATTS